MEDVNDTFVKREEDDDGDTPPMPMAVSTLPAPMEERTRPSVLASTPPSLSWALHECAMTRVVPPPGVVATTRGVGGLTPY